MFTEKDLLEKAKTMPPEYLVEVYAAANRVHGGMVYMEEQAYNDLRTKFQNNKGNPGTTKAKLRAEICNGCSDCKMVSWNPEAKFPLMTVSCKACGCGGLSLVSGTCPKQKWPV